MYLRGCMAKNTNIDMIIQDIQKTFGSESIHLLGNSVIPPIDVVSTGSLTLDIALGVGGLPRGRISEIAGPDAAGKTTICQHIIAQGQLTGMTCAYIDMEHALDLNYAAACGIQIDKLLFSQPDYGEQALAIAERLIKSEQVGIIVLDSVAALVPRAEIEGDIGDQFVGIQARMMSQVLRRLSSDVKKANCILLFTNQLRQKIGVTWGSNEVTSGGLALKYYASVRLDIRRIKSLSNGENPIGIRVRVRVIKNKVAPPLRQAEFDIRYGKGIDHTAELFDLGIHTKLITRRGAFYYWDDQRLGQGRENILLDLEKNPEKQQALFAAVKQRMSQLPTLLINSEETIE